MLARQVTCHDNGPRLRRLFQLRAVIFTGQVLAILLAGYWLEPNIGWLMLALSLAVITLANLLIWRALRNPPAQLLLAQLLVDIAGLAVLLYFIGGATNPFIWLLLLPVVIAATALSRSQTWVVAAAAAGAYSALLRFYHPIPEMRALSDAGFALHIIGMWAGFIVSTLLIAHFLSTLAAHVRARDRALADAREQALRDEKLVSLGALAAGAAHELGTPLGTLALLTEEIDADIKRGAHNAVEHKLSLMRGQVERCKAALADMTLSAGIDAAYSGQSMRVAEFLDATVDDWRARRASVQMSYRTEGARPGPAVVAEKNFAKALMNIFDNAADASPDDVQIDADWTDDSLAVRVADRGPGLTPTERAQVGKVQFSTKRNGRGIGLYLTHGIVTRLGGKLNIVPRTGGGTTVEIRLPLAGLKV